MSDDSRTHPPGGQFLVYQPQDGNLKIDVRFERETAWLTQQHISLYIHNIYEELELERMAAVKESLTAADARPVDADFDQATNKPPKP